MNLEVLIQMQATMQGITEAARKTLWKKTGKGQGMDAIEQEIRDTINRFAYRSGRVRPNRTSQKLIDQYVTERMGYMKKSFSKLNNPQTDTSLHRAKFIGRTENHSAKEFGKALGQSQSDGDIYKMWVTDSGNPCDECSENEDAGPIPADELFPSGDYSPGAHPNAVLEGSTFHSYGRPIQMLRARYDGPAITLEVFLDKESFQLASGNACGLPYLTEWNVGFKQGNSLSNLAARDRVTQKRLTIGPNHPVLTRRGFVSAEFIKEGDELLYDQRSETSYGVGELNLEQMPLVENVFESLVPICGYSGVSSPGTYFHGDEAFIYGEVDTVRPTRGLLGELQSGVLKKLCKCSFLGTNTDALHVARCRSCQAAFEGVFFSPASIMGSFGARGMNRPLVPVEILAHAGSVPFEHRGYFVHADAASMKFSSDVPSEFIRCKVLSVHRHSFSGWAFDASTTDTVYASNGFVVKNCACFLQFMRNPDEDQ